MSSSGGQSRSMVLLTVLSLVSSTVTAASDLLGDDQFQPRAPSMQQLTAAVRRWARVEQVKRGILDQLGLEEPPNYDLNATDFDQVDQEPVLATYRRYVQQSVDSNEDKQSEDVVQQSEDHQKRAKHFYSFTATPAGFCSESPNEHVVQFPLDIPEPEVSIASATLRLRVRNSISPERTVSGSAHETLVKIYHLIERRHQGDENAIYSRFERRFVTSRSLLHRPGDRRGRSWEEFDVTTAIQSHVETGDVGGESNVVRLAVIINSRNNSTKLMLGGTGCRRNNGSEMTEHVVRHRPVLNIVTSKESSSGQGQRSPRSRRSALNVQRTVSLDSSHAPDPVCTAGDGETRCCRRSLWISFRDIGWDSWIIEPSGYQAYYCDGSCPPGHLPAHNHATVRQLLLAASSAQAGHGGRPGWPPFQAPTCGATRLSSLPLVLRIDGRQMVAIFENMIVDQCRCL